MAPSAITPSPPSTPTLTKAGEKHSLYETAPSLVNKNGQSTASSSLSELDASLLRTTYTTSPKSVPLPDSPEAASTTVATDHMMTCAWNASTGWAAPELRPYGPLSLMPSASVLHYATECFEGMKAYRGADGRLRIFRPERNCKRMLRSALRVALPAFDPAELQKLIEKFVAVDLPKWLPKERPGQFIYLRPTLIGTDHALGVKKPNAALLYIIAIMFPSLDSAAPAPSLTATPTVSVSSTSNNGTSAPKPNTALRLMASREDQVRSWPGGFGFAKVGGSYAGTLQASEEAKKRGYSQVLWLFGKDCEVTEAGAANFFAVWRTKEGVVQLVTPPLDEGLVLEGVTRASVLELARERLSKSVNGLESIETVEKKFTMHEIVEAAREGRLIETFASGTAVSCFPHHSPFPFLLFQNAKTQIRQQQKKNSY